MDEGAKEGRPGEEALKYGRRPGGVEPVESGGHDPESGKAGFWSALNVEIG